MVEVFEIEDKEFKTSAHKRKLSLNEKCDWSTEYCIICKKELMDDGEGYYHWQCKLSFHRSCIDDLQDEIKSPLHPQHSLLLEVDGWPVNGCNCCGTYPAERGPVYECHSCSFVLDVQCALVDFGKSSSIKMERGKSKFFVHFAHEDLLIYKETEKNIDSNCFVCASGIKAGPIYKCCLREIYIHKSCAELPREIQNHHHPEHSLFLFARTDDPFISLPIASTRQPRHLCRGCMNKTSNFHYFCPICDFSFDVQCLLPSPNYEDHQHIFSQISIFQNFKCRACGEEGESFPWVCTICHIIVHGKCAEVPQAIEIYGHNHPLNLTYYNIDRLNHKITLCQICRKVNKGHAIYICSPCNYVTHLECAKEQYNMYLATEVKEKINEEEKVYQNILHQHELTLINELEVDGENDNKYCEGCLDLIFKTPFYSCAECDFFLHQQCSTLSRRKRFLILPGVFSLIVDQPFSIFDCNICKRYNHGFHYQLDKSSQILDIRCAYIANGPLIHPSHEHLLHPVCKKQLEDHEICSCCHQKNHIPSTFSIYDGIFVFACDKCHFLLHYKCATLPNKARHKYDQHALQLTYTVEDDSGEYYCDICENKRDPECWFYHCKDCFFSAHPHCVLGDHPYLKPFKYHAHPHLLTYTQMMDIRICRICNKELLFLWTLECARCKFYICGQGNCFQATIQKGELTFHNKRGG